MIPVLLFSLWAQASVTSTFNRYNKVRNARAMTGADAARLILDRNGLHHVRIEHISGTLTDHYDPRDNVIRLSDAVYASPTVAAVGVAAHEAGHAVQYAEQYAPIRLRASIVSLTQFASKWSVYILMFGLLLSVGILAEIGFWLYAVVAFFQLVTLPVEFNASRRAMQALSEGGALSGEELSGAKKVLGAAAMTYVAALLSALVQLLRLWSIVSSSRRRR
ncbi:MAG: zinc metallopeptidase [Clostridia bacterium]|nr:zinc metallopeptidase [Clostridia bacterium]